VGRAPSLSFTLKFAFKLRKIRDNLFYTIPFQLSLKSLNSSHCLGSHMEEFLGRVCTNMQDIVGISWCLFYAAEPAIITERHMRNSRMSQRGLVGHVKEDPVLNTFVFLPVVCSFSETLA
jgi:hypothetical protein